MNQDEIDLGLYEKHFRVTVFGSARIKPNDPIYHQVYNLAKLVAAENIDVITGGGPGLMDAANKGHQEGRKTNSSYSIGLNIKIPEEQKPNRHLDIKKEFNKFSVRLDTFIGLSDVVVVAPGGVGTLLELVYAWQLVQVKKVSNLPIILLGDIWKEFLKWVESYPLKQQFLLSEDVDYLLFAGNYYEAFKIIKQLHEKYKEGRIC